MKFASVRVAVAALAMAGIGDARAFAAQPIILPPYPHLTTVIYDIDYAASIPKANAVRGVSADTIVSIGLPSGVQTQGCEAQVQWLAWDGAGAGVSGPTKNVDGTVIALVPGQTLEYTTSSNGNPNNYPNFQENVFRSIATEFEGSAQVRISCPNGQTLRGLSVDAEFVTQSGPAGVPPLITSKTIVVSKPTGVSGY